MSSRFSQEAVEAAWMVWNEQARDPDPHDFEAMEESLEAAYAVDFPQCVRPTDRDVEEAQKLLEEADSPQPEEPKGDWPITVERCRKCGAFPITNRSDLQCRPCEPMEIQVRPVSEPEQDGLEAAWRLWAEIAPRFTATYPVPWYAKWLARRMDAALATTPREGKPLD